MMRNTFQRIALTAFIAVEILIFVGAIVRASGSGLGCPDWPLCYGLWLPPTQAEQIDPAKFKLEKFREKAARHGRDPESITVESLRAEFDPVSTWVEYFNRLTSLPVGISIVALLAASVGQFKLRRPSVFMASLAAFLLVMLNAWLGARVVLSGLKPGIITLHMALAILLQCVLVYTTWKGTQEPWRLKAPSTRAIGLFWMGCALLLFVVFEGILGSQVREMTDQLSKLHQGELRSQWVDELEHTMVYIIHRSFSWVVLLAGFAYAWVAKKALGKLGWLEQTVVGLILAQMVLGIILAHVGIVRTAQVLHIGLSSLLVSGLFLWILGAWRARLGTPESGTAPSTLP